MIDFSVFASGHRLVIFCALGLIAGALAWWVASGKARQHALLASRAIPWISRRMEDFQLAMIFQALALLLKGGYSMTQAVEVAAQSALSETPEVFF